jgi:hypothetical protein
VSSPDNDSQPPSTVETQLYSEQIAALQSLGIDTNNEEAMNAVANLPTEALEALLESLNPQERKLVLQDPTAITAIANAASAIEQASSIDELEKIGAGSNPQIASVIHNLKLSRQSELEATKAVGALLGGHAAGDKAILFSGILGNAGFELEGRFGAIFEPFANENSRASDFSLSNLSYLTPDPIASGLQAALALAAQESRNAAAVGIG